MSFINILLSAILADSLAFCLFAFGCVVRSHIDIASIFLRWYNHAYCYLVPIFDEAGIGPLPWDDFRKFSSLKVLTANQTLIHQCGRCYHWYIFSHCWFRIVSMSEFNKWLSIRVGEASHPGPSHVRIAVINPTAVYGKVDEIVEIGADAVICSETSLTISAQKSCQRSFDKHGFKCFWSCAVKSKKDLGDDRPSFRGEAAGTAILSKLESRQHRFEYKDEIWQSCRISSAVLRIGSFEILVIAIYGFPDRNAQTIRLNDILLAHAYDMAAKSGLPFIVAGDFNTDVHQLPCFQNYKALGCVEFFAHSRNAWDLQLPPTCRGATYNDTMIIHPLLIPLMAQAQVSDSHIFEPHSPIILSLFIKDETPVKLVWDLPKSWKDFQLQREKIADAYHECWSHFDFLDTDICSASDGDHALHQWSQAVECAVDKAIRSEFLENPTRMPICSLPESYRGRCRPRKILKKTSPCGPKGDLHGGYNPQVEVFSVVAKQKVRQLRRMMSFQRACQSCIRTYGDLCCDKPPFQQLCNEWLRILNAAGYGRAWYRWILSFEAVGLVPVELPSSDQLQTFISITKIDADTACHQESQTRACVFKYSISLDNSEGFGKTTYALMKDSSNAKLTEVPHTLSVYATLCRAGKGVLRLHIDDKRDFRTNHTAKFGNATISILHQDQNVLTIRVVDGVIPSRAIVSQQIVATSPKEIFQVFDAFWSPYWLRDTRDEENSGESWHEFHDELSKCEFPQCDISIDLSDIQLWIDTIHQLPNNKAGGICGWKYEEIKDLPPLAVQHLASIFKRLWSVGLSRQMMQARTTLLAKVDCPTSMNHGRPITVLSTLYRLVTKILYGKISQVWAKNLPMAISGGLPARGVRDLAFEQNFFIEQHVQMSHELCGVSIDLSKAFNLVPRYPARALLKKLGVPDDVIQFWALSISRLSRVVLFRGQIGYPVNSTTGIPEGDSFSVLIMIALSAFFYYRMVRPQVWPAAYADNWSWMSTSDKECFQAFIRVLNLAQSIKMVVDIAKSWVWGTSKSMKMAVKNFDILFPSNPNCLSLRNSIRDLGEIVQYNKQRVAKPIVSRVAKGRRRIEKLQWLPVTLQHKCERIQGSGWSYSLYGADTHYLGKTHFHGLRQSALKALGASHKTASPWLACTVLSKFLMDPLLWVILCMLRSIRRLATISMDRAKNFIAFVVNYQGIFPFGPATTFAKYLEIVEWTLDLDGTLHLYFDHSLNILQDSAKKIKRIVSRAFHEFVFQQVDHRRGIPNDRIDVELLHKVFSKMSDADQKILLLNLVGGYQTNTAKSRWNSEIDVTCECCDQPDHTDHRLLFCPAMERIRNEHPEAVSILSSHRINWIYHPFPTLCPETRLIDAINSCIHLSHPSILENVEHPSHLNMFTDGGCEYPADYTSRRGSWAVVVDTSPSNGIAADASIPAKYNSSYQHPTMKCVATGLVSGEQTASRGELIAILQAIRYAVSLETCVSATIYTDARYVINVTQHVHNDDFGIRTDKIQNWDLIAELQTLWFLKTLNVIKVKSHRTIDSAVDTHDLWTILGNNFADLSASASLKYVPQQIKQLYADAHHHRERERKFLLKVFPYIAALNRERCSLIQNIESDNLPLRRTRVADLNACETQTPLGLLLQYSVPNSYIHDIPVYDDHWAGACLQGANLAKAVWEWSKTLKWPQDPDLHGPCSWGISYLELLVNFHICTGFLPPLRISGQGSSSVYLDYFSDLALLQGASKRSMGSMVFGFQALIRSISSVAGGPILPSFGKTTGTSIYRLGFRGKMPGISIRPEICQNNLTMQTIHNYLQKLDNKKSLSLPLGQMDSQPCIIVERILEPNVDERYKRYLKLAKERNRQLR